MDFFEDEDEYLGGGLGGRLLKSARAQTLRYSNFLITISTNRVPSNQDEEMELTGWLIDHLTALFGDFSKLNGYVLKPAGTRNEQLIKFPANNRIMGVRSKISIERGNTDKQRGQVHAHVLLEVAHEYLGQEHGAIGTGQDMGRKNVGVHVNVYGLREYLNYYIREMKLDKLPKKIYVNCRLLTKGTDNSNKWLTLQYIDKTVAKDNDGGTRDLIEDERVANNPELSEIKASMQDPDENIRMFREDILDGTEEDRAASPEPPVFQRTTAAPPSFVRTTAAAPSFVRTTKMKSFKK